MRTTKALAAIALVVLISLAGCGPSPSPTPIPTAAASPTPSPTATLRQTIVPGDASKGEKLFSSIGCIGCHTVRGVGGRIGPELSDVGSRRDLAYIQQAVREPQAFIVPGYPPDMPSAEAMGLSDQDIADLVAYLSGLK